MSTKSRYEKLKSEIRKHNYLYDVKDAPIISDLEFDKLLNELKQIEAEHPEWITSDSPMQRAGAKPADINTAPATWRLPPWGVRGIPAKH